MEVCLQEWRKAAAGPESPFPMLNGLYLEDSTIRRSLERHPLGDRLRVSECRHGLVIEARQHVGVLQLGPIRVRIQPKMPTGALWAAVTYALGLDEIIRHAPVELDMAGDFADLLALMMLQESERLWRTGIQRGYRETNEWRQPLRGRPDVVALARSGPLTEAALPCRYHAFTADIIENQLVLAGLGLARQLTGHLPLRSALHRAHQQWSTVCRRVLLDRTLLDRADRSRNRLTARYAGVHRLVRLLYEQSGLDDDHTAGTDVLPGFLWNMASLFERFVARFLSENLPDHEVLTQEKLRHLYKVIRGGPSLKAPRPRPDLVIRRKRDRKVIGVFDTKYRDLWATKLPREILYQLSVYALAWSERGGEDVPAIVLYPAVGGVHPDMEMTLRVRGATPRQIILRSVDWAAAASRLGQPQVEVAERWAGVT
mgnify:CR=1 FL=1